MLELDEARLGLVPGGWQSVYRALPARIEQRVPGLGSAPASDPVDCVVELAARLLQPVTLRRLPIPPAQFLAEERAAATVERCLIQSRHPVLAGEALVLALQLVRAAGKRGPAPVASVQQWRLAAAAIRRRARAVVAHVFTNAVLEEAAQRGLRLEVLLEGIPAVPLVQLGSGSGSRMLASTCGDADSYFGATICRNKSYSHQFLKRLGYRVPRQVALSRSFSPPELKRAAALIGYPCVVKPCDGELGAGVTSNIRDDASLLSAAASAQAATRRGNVLLEEHVPGDYHRLVVIEGQLLRVVRYQPPHLIGDGERSIEAILAAPRSDQSLPGAVLSHGPPPRLDAAVLRELLAQGLTPESVPAIGRRVVLRCDLQDREDWVDTAMLDRVDPSLHRLAEGIARALGMANVGIDVISPDITAPPPLRELWVIEVNAMQRLHPGMAPLLLDQIFPCTEAARIPVRVAVCVEESDWPGSELLGQLLDGPDGCALAIPRRLEGRLSPSLRASLERRGPVVAYDHPREVLLNRSLEAVLFLLDWQELSQSGLPAVQVDQVCLLGAPPAAMAGAWQRLQRWVDPGEVAGASCELPDS